MRDMKTNFVGPMDVTNAILPHMRMRRDGTIVFIGSRSAYRSQMVVSTFLPCIPRFLSQLVGYTGTGYVLHLSGDTRARADAYPYAQPRTLRPKLPSTVRDVPWLSLGHPIDS